MNGDRISFGHAGNPSEFIFLWYESPCERTCLNHFNDIEYTRM